MYLIFSVTQVSKGDEQNHKRSGHKKNKGRKKNKNLTSVQPNHTLTGPRSHSTTADPCLTSHVDYCIHGHCTYLHGLREPVCVWVKLERAIDLNATVYLNSYMYQNGVIEMLNCEIYCKNLKAKKT